MTQSEAILVTLGLELPIAAFLVTRLSWAPGRLRFVVAASLAASALTHPMLWMVDPVLTPTIPSRGLRVGLLEALIVLVEAGVYRLGTGLSPRRSVVVSCVANAASLGAGLLIYALATPP